MADEPITIPLTAAQQALFRSWKQQHETISSLINAAVTSIAAGQIDPQALREWTVKLNEDRIVFTPPTAPVDVTTQ